MKIKEILDSNTIFVFESDYAPTNPKLWEKAKNLAKKTFKVYPSAYANAWAAKKYKELGGKWKKKKT